jgi:hypothetical protein
MTPDARACVLVTLAGAQRPVTLRRGIQVCESGGGDGVFYYADHELKALISWRFFGPRDDGWYIAERRIVPLEQHGGRFFADERRRRPTRLELTKNEVVAIIETAQLSPPPQPA